MAGLLDFAATAGAIPEFASAWGEIAAQLDVEGAANAQVEGTKVAFVNAFEQLSSQAVGMVGGENIEAAKQFVMIGQTVAGAVHMATGLVEAIQNESPPAVMQAFTGTMIGLAVSSGALTAGAGAAIVGAVGAVMAILSSAGLFATATFEVDFPIGPDIGGIALNDGGTARAHGNAQVAPGSARWRTFPRRDVAPDADWFDTSRVKAMWPGVWACGRDRPAWKGLSFGGKVQQGKRSIDQAFPQFSRVARDAGLEGAEVPADVHAPALLWPRSAFHVAFARACMLNWEFLLNGLKAQPDEQVLIHTLRIWNRAHEGPAIPMGSAPGTYAQSIVSGALGALGGDRTLQTADGRALLLNVGAQKGLPPLPAGDAAAKHVIALRLSSPNAAAAAASAYRTAGEAAASRKATSYVQQARAAALVTRAEGAPRPVTLESLGSAVRSPSGHVWWLLGIAAAIAAVWANEARKG